VDDLATSCTVPPVRQNPKPDTEADGKALNEDLYGFNLGYKITFREL
jgi:hypothetical protein